MSSKAVTRRKAESLHVLVIRWFSPKSSMSIDSLKDDTLQFTNAWFRSGDLTKQERRDYVKAVLCLQGLPARTPRNVSSGVRSRVSVPIEESQ